MNISTLKKEYHNAINNKRRGTLATKTKYTNVMNNITFELSKTNSLPIHWSEVNNQTIDVLIQRWKAIGNSDKTISNKLGILRHVIKGLTGGYCNFDANLNFVEPIKPKIIKPLNPIDLDIIQDDIVRNIMEFELNFGLTKTEAMKLNNTIQLSSAKNEITILRTIAHNQKRRTVPITNAKQRDIVQSRLALIHKSNTIFHRKESLSKLYHSMVEVYCLPKSLRLYYINNRAKSLLDCGTANRKVLQMLSDELGIKNLTSLKGYLWQI